MLNESAMEKWFRFEMARINSGIVLKKKSLSELLGQEIPKTSCRDGSEYYFNKETIIRLGETLPRHMHDLRLPISFYTSLDVPGSAYIADKPSYEAIKTLGEIPSSADLVDGKYWLSKILVSDMMRKWPSLIQFIRY